MAASPMRPQTAWAASSPAQGLDLDTGFSLAPWLADGAKVVNLSSRLGSITLTTRGTRMRRVTGSTVTSTKWAA